MMKKYFFLATAALVALAACSKSPIVESVNAGEAVVDPDEIFADSDKYPISFASNVVSTKAMVKGGGSIEAWNNQTLYVYGITRDVAADTLNWKDGVEIENVPVYPASGVKDTILVTDALNNPYYYNNSARYDFFGYYVDDAFVTGQEDPENRAGTIVLPIHIDGTQDVMLAYADRDSAVKGTSYSAEKMFSAYGVRKGIIPNLKFKHQLSRFVFKVVKGEDINSAVGKVYVDSLCVQSFAEAEMTIVGANRGLEVPAGAEMEDFYLTDRGVDLAPVLVEGATPLNLGESMMVMPGLTSYNLKFRLGYQPVVESGDPDTVYQWVEGLNIPISGGAVAGKSYTITLTVYNLQTIYVSVELEPWDTDTDPINIGQDED